MNGIAHKKHGSSYRVINFPMLLKVTGWLLLVESAFMLIPVITCLVYEEWADFWPFLCVNLFTAIVGWGMRSIHCGNSNMGRREGFLLTASVWLWFSLFGMLPFIFTTAHFGVSDAFFEAMSGFTTTGASVLDSHDSLGRGVNVWRALSQWIGGMGIILFTLAVIPMLNSAGGMQMFNAEVTGITHDKVRPRISSTAKYLWGIYLGLTIILWGMLWAGPMNFFDAMCYTFSSMSTGGFAPWSVTLSQYDSDYAVIVLTIFMFLGGVNFSLIYKFLSGSPDAFWKNEVFRWYIYLIAIFYVIFALAVVWQGGPLTWENLTIIPLFQVVTTITSTGLDSGSFTWWSPLVISLTMLMMFLGSCAGSTSGGAKIDRMVYLVKTLRNELIRCVRPNAVMSVRIDGKVKSPALVDKVTAFMCIYVILIFAGGVALAAMGIPIIDAFFSAFSCISNTGLCAEVTQMGTTYSIIPDAGKWVLSALMLIGRLELFTVLVLFTRPFWRK